MLWWHLGMVEGPDGARREGLGPAMALTLGRAWLVPALPLVAGAPWAFATLFAAGALADAADGPVARRRGEETRLGAQADGAVDACFALSAAWTAAAAGWLPAWAAALVTARYLVPPLLIAVVYFARAAAPPREAFVPGRLPGVAVAAGLGAGRRRAGPAGRAGPRPAGHRGRRGHRGALDPAGPPEPRGPALDHRPVARRPGAREHAVMPGRTIMDDDA